MRMKAAVLEEFGEPLVIQELELQDPQPGEVLVRLVACGVCHTDLYTASGVDPSGYAPAVLGHEGAGVVEQVGEGVTSVSAGDHVVTLFSPQCGECVHCVDPRTNLCMAIRAEQNLGHLPDGRRPELERRPDHRADSVVRDGGRGAGGRLGQGRGRAARHSQDGQNASHVLPSPVGLAGKSRSILRPEPGSKRCARPDPGLRPPALGGMTGRP